MGAVDNGERVTNLNGLNLWYKVSGAGPVCIFTAPGWGPSSELYFRTLKQMEQFFTVVYLDTRGSGRSERPASSGDYKYDDFSNDMDALRQHLKQDRVWVMGHSMGGWLAMHYAISHPEGCCGLVLLDSIVAHDADWKNDAKARQLARQQEPWYEETMRIVAEAQATKDGKALAAAAQVAMRFAFHDVAHIEKLREAAGPFSPHAQQGMSASNKGGAYFLPLEQINCPAMIVVGASDDRCSVSQAERLHLGIRGSKLIVIEKAGHFPWLEQPERFIDAVGKGLRAFGLQAPGAA